MPSSLGNHILVILTCMRLTSIVIILYYLGFLPLHRIAFVKWLSRSVAGISKMYIETPIKNEKLETFQKDANTYFLKQCLACVARIRQLWS